MNLTNLWLWLLTLRASDFVDPELNTGITYNAGTTEAIRRARSLLCLSDTRTDFHVLGAMHAAIRYSRFANLPECPNTFFNKFSLPTIRPVEVTGATLVPSTSQRWPIIRNYPTQIPAPTTFTLVKQGDRIVVTDDTGVTNEYTYRTTGQIVIVDSLVPKGIDTGFEDATWPDGKTVTVFCEPGRYPYAYVSNLINQDRTMTTFMLDHIDASALDDTAPVSRVGALALSIMMAQYKLNGEPLMTVPDNPMTLGLAAIHIPQI